MPGVHGVYELLKLSYETEAVVIAGTMKMESDDDKGKRTATFDEYAIATKDSTSPSAYCILLGSLSPAELSTSVSA